MQYLININEAPTSQNLAESKDQNGKFCVGFARRLEFDVNWCFNFFKADTLKNEKNQQMPETMLSLCVPDTSFITKHNGEKLLSWKLWCPPFFDSGN